MEDERDERDAGEPELAEPSQPEQWSMPEPTGVQAVDDALASLLDLDQLPTAEHVGVYDAAHRRLQDALADLDSA